MQKSKSKTFLRSPFTALILLFSMISPSAQATIYGDVDLVDVMVAEDLVTQTLSRSVAVQMRNSNISFEKKFSNHRTLQNAMVCSTEKFIQQPVLGTCTGFLISPRHLLTANHCFFGNDDPCKTSSWVFDFAVGSDSQTQFSTRPENVYACKKVVAANYSHKLDFAIVELDRPVAGRTPLKLNLSEDAAVSQKIFSIHSPRGLPLKRSDGFVRDSSQTNHFTSAIDLMRGSSGGPVFDAETLEVIGIVAQGDHDYETQDEPFCNAYKRCLDDQCRGEDATRITRIPDLQTYVGH